MLGAEGVDAMYVDAGKDYDTVALAANPASPNYLPARLDSMATYNTDFAWSASFEQYVRFIIVNWGANDMHDGYDEPTLKTQLGAHLDYLHARYPFALVYVTRPWRRTYNGPADDFADHIAEVVSTRTSFAKLGDDERVWFENGDDGEAFGDGTATHYNVPDGVTRAAEVRRDMILADLW